MSETQRMAPGIDRTGLGLTARSLGLLNFHGGGGGGGKL
jgi:hypothetical protein